MRSLREFGSALVTAVISIGLIIGALSISLVEFNPEPTPTPTSNIFPSPVPITATDTLPATETSTQSIETSAPSITPSLVNTATPPLSCLPPLGWVSQIIILSSDTLDSLAARYNIGRDALKSANCLISDILVPGTHLYVPPVSTNTPAVCSKGAAGWINGYVVKPGDTIYAIATNHYTTAGLLKSVNCKSSDLIVSGEVLWIPNIATRTPYPTAMPGMTVTPQPTDPLTQTALPFTATFFIPTNTSIPPISTMIPTGTASLTPPP
ncbi:MAG: LysM peptidoglycan-binding domain-containing protein [Chloroflexi bacterium]|nr:LysM peptidoglycan-binding domain-containing protein [Chloroflexota bacterium]